MSNANFYACRACRACYACCDCFACYACYACDTCCACDNCFACYACDTCCACRTCDTCRACYVCRACDICCACRACEQIKNSFFCFKIECSKNMLFNKQVEEGRIYEVREKWNELRGDWLPWQTNGYELYLKADKDWSKINSQELKTIEWEESWKSIPTKLLDYIISLPEFDKDIFKKITGINIDNQDSEIKKAIRLLEEKGKLVDGKLLKI